MGEVFFSLDGPLDAIPAEGQMRAANFRGLPDLIRQMGADPRGILERHGLDAQTIRDPDHYVGCQSLVDVLEDCATSLEEPLFGLRLAQLQEPEVFGCVTALCRSAPTVREALDSFIEYMPVVHSPMARIELAEGKDTSELRWGVVAELGANSQAQLQAILLDLKFVRALGGRTFRPSYVSLAMDIRPAFIPEIETSIGCQFHARAGSNAIAFPTSVLDQPVLTADKLLYRLLGGYLARVKAASRRSLVNQVEDYIRSSLPSGNCTIERCAKRLGTSVRSLQGHLSERGLKFSDMLEVQRVELAMAYLEQDDTPLDEVAELLGYSEQSSFGRAFKRWTGSTPQRYRAEALKRAL